VNREGQILVHEWSILGALQGESHWIDPNAITSCQRQTRLHVHYGCPSPFQVAALVLEDGSELVIDDKGWHHANRIDSSIRFRRLQGERAAREASE